MERARPLPGRGLLKAWLAENAYCEEVQVGFQGLLKCDLPAE